MAYTTLRDSTRVRLAGVNCELGVSGWLSTCVILLSLALADLALAFYDRLNGS